MGDGLIDRRNITVVLADDHAVFRGVLRLLVEAAPEMQILAEAADVADAERLTLVHRPRVLVLDLNMPGGSSMEAIPRLHEQSPDTAIVVLTMHDDPGYAESALQTGALGFVLKEDAEDELLTAIRLAAVGDTYLNPRLARASPPGGGHGVTTGPADRTRR